MKKILLILFFISMATNVCGEVQFLNVGGPRITRTFELKAFQYNESDVRTIKVSVTHDIHGEFYSYIITPSLKEIRYIKGASAQFWCNPINLQFNKKLFIDKDGKAVRFTYGINEHLKKDVRVKVSLILDDDNSIVFNIDDSTEKAETNEISERHGGLQVK